MKFEVELDDDQIRRSINDQLHTKAQILVHDLTAAGFGKTITEQMQDIKFKIPLEKLIAERVTRAIDEEIDREIYRTIPGWVKRHVKSMMRIATSQLLAEKKGDE